jgi:hypothetical protein
VETQITSKSPRIRSAHLMCGQPIWGIAGVLSCSYLAYLSWARVRREEFDWPHDSWSIVTYAVWILLMGGLLSETRCWRERIFFALVLTNFVLGFVLAIWSTTPNNAVREVRIISAALWALAAAVSLIVTFSSGSSRAATKKAGNV